MKLVHESLNEYFTHHGGREFHEGHPLSKYHGDGSKKDPDAKSGIKVNGEELTWDEYWDWYEREGEPDY